VLRCQPFRPILRDFFAQAVVKKSTQGLAGLETAAAVNTSHVRMAPSAEAPQLAAPGRRPAALELPAISSLCMSIPRGALIPIRTWLPRISRTVTVMAVPIVTDCLSRRVNMRMIGALALQAGIHPNVVGRLERGIYNPTVLILFAIAMKLNTSLAELFAGAAKRQ
jgi:DNA-binding XRE family transcriptional regulator